MDETEKEGLFSLMVPMVPIGTEYSECLCQPLQVRLLACF